MTISTPVHTGERSIERVLAAGVPILLVFWQRDCEICYQLDATLDRLAEEYADRALIARVDAHIDPALARRYEVLDLPGLVFIVNKRVVGRSAGVASETSLRAWIEYMLYGGSQPALPQGPSIPLKERRTSSTASSDVQYTSPQQPVTPIHITDSTFQHIVLGNNLPVLVDFWAPWCGPCRVIAPSLNRLAQEFAGRIVIAKLNIDENQRTAQRFAIRSIPTLYLFRQAKVVDKLMGAQPIGALRQAILRHLDAVD